MDFLLKYRNLTYFVVWLMLLSAFTLHARRATVKGDLSVKESRSVLVLCPIQSNEGLYFISSDFNNPQGKSLFSDNFVSSEDLTQQLSPSNQIPFQNYLFVRENQKRTALRFFAYLKN